jgi:hypothetical protein
MIDSLEVKVLRTPGKGPFPIKKQSCRRLRSHLAAAIRVRFWRRVQCTACFGPALESARFGTPDVKTNATLLQIVLVPILRCLFLKTEL